MTTKAYGHIANIDGLRRLRDVLERDDKLLGFDVETGYNGPNRIRGSLNPAGDSFLVGFSITNDERWARYVPLRHDYGPNLDVDQALEIMKPVLEQKRLVAHNGKFEKRVMRTEGIEVGIKHDSCLEAYVLSEWPGFNLKKLVRDEFGHEMATIESLFPNLKKKDIETLRFNHLDLSPDVVAYACEDAAWCLALHNKIGPRAAEERGFVLRLEHAIADLMSEVEDWGVEADFEAMALARAKLVPFIEKFERAVVAGFEAMAGKKLVGFKLNSHKELSALLFNEPEAGGLGLKTTRVTKGGKKSTDAVSLEKLSKTYQPVRDLLSLREAVNNSKRFDLWLEVDKRQPQVKGRDGRVHANYNQVRVGTGRFAANDPPIQQMPKDLFWAYGAAQNAYLEAKKAGKDEEICRAEARDAANPGETFEANFRDFIVAPPGHYLLGFDYSQIELRVFAGLAKEPALLNAFADDVDVHTLTASKMYGVPLANVDDKMRAGGKTYNFALVYGMGPQSLADRLAISLQEAKRLYDAYFQGYPAITSYAQRQKERSRSLGYTESWIGRKYTVWELQSANKAVYSKGERVLVNAPVQGGAADYVKIAMTRVRKVLVDAGWWGAKVKLIMNQHDALMFEVSNDLDPREVMKLLRPAVEFPVAKFPKIVSDWEFGHRWGSNKRCDETSPFTQVDGEWSIGPPTSEPDLEELMRTHENLEGSLDIMKFEETGEWTEPQEPDVPQTRELIVEIQEMPEMQAYSRFLSLVKSNPGNASVTLKTPQGDVTGFPNTSLTPTDQASVSVALGGATVFYAVGSVDTASIASELSL